MTKKPVKQRDNDFPKMSNPAHDALEAAGYTRLEQLTKVTEKEIANLHGMGPKSIKELNEALAARGWSFAPKQK
ncbi:MAG: DNA-binding protein [Anaerolineae bacterium]|nr:DNA-binding protein [Anaerolineae bacterium]